ncbi:MAG: glycosyltransferase family 2 protein [Bacteroidia bacterium]|nr:glycosyltransferase family 2 protein [Bacteroidia bacterium]
MPSSPSNTYIIIPSFNEGRVAKRVVLELLDLEYQVILVDDGSTDDTIRLLSSLPIHLLRHRVNLGQGAALMTGMCYAKKMNAEYVVHFDADGQHDASYISDLLTPLRKKETDVTLGSRFLDPSSIQRIPKGRRIVLQIARWINFAFTGLLLTDAHNGFRALNRKALQKVNLNESGRAHATEILSEIKRCELQWKEIPVMVHYSDYSRSKGTSFLDGFQVLGDLLTSKIRRT